MVGRVLAIVVMGLLLLAISGLIRSAAAGQAGDAMPSIWIVWLAAGAATLALAAFASSARLAWGRLCLLNGLASLTLLLVSLVARASPGAASNATAEAIESLGVARPIGAALGGALVSGALGIAAVTLAVVLFVASAFLLRPTRRHAHAG